MPYKIIQSIERHRTILTVVPSLWEENGILWWPPKKNRDKIIKDGESKPNKEWQKLKCVVKRRNIPTYQQADNEISAMELNSDTDHADTQENLKAINAQQQQPVLQEQLNFELLADNLTFNQETSNIISNTTTENVLPVYTAETLHYGQIFENQKIISDKIDDLHRTQAVVIENQKKIIQTLANFCVQQEEMTQQLRELSDNSRNNDNVRYLSDKNSADNESFSLKPIENELELRAFEQLLLDKAYKLKLQKQLTFLCPLSDGAGITCAYKLVDILFSREFLCLCSWSGGSRGEKSKIALKDYKNILNFFFKMIHNWDSTYTVQENESFFKIITKNASQRKAMKNVRMSTKRMRKTATSSKRQKTADETQSYANEIPNSNSDDETQIKQTENQERIENQKMISNCDNENESCLC